MADESGTVRLSKAWLTPQIIVMVIGFAVTTFASWKLSDYRISQLEMSMHQVIEKLDQRATLAETERIEWARTATRLEGKLDRLEEQYQQLRDELQMTSARLISLERKN